MIMEDKKMAMKKEAKDIERYVLFGSGPDTQGAHVDKCVNYDTGEEVDFDKLIEDVLFGDDMPIEYSDYEMSAFFDAISNAGGITLNVDYYPNKTPDEAVEKVNDYFNTFIWMRYDEMTDEHKKEIDEKMNRNKDKEESMDWDKDILKKADIKENEEFELDIYDDGTWRHEKVSDMSRVFPLNQKTASMCGNFESEFFRNIAAGKNGENIWFIYEDPNSGKKYIAKKNKKTMKASGI